MEGHPPANPYWQRSPDRGKVSELPRVKPAKANPIRVPRSVGAAQRANSGWIVGNAMPCYPTHTYSYFDTIVICIFLVIISFYFILFLI